MTIEQISYMATVVTAVAIVVSAVGAVLLYFQTKKGIAQREALTVIRDQIGDRDWIEDQTAWRTLRNDLAKANNGEPIKGFDLARALEPYAMDFDANGIGEKFFERRALIIRRLNRYEMIAVGIRTQSIDENVFRLWWATSYVSEFITHRFFIAKARQEKSKIYREFHWLAYRFADAERRQTIANALGEPRDRHPDAHSAITLFEDVLRHWKILAFISLLFFAYYIGKIN